jgi:amidase
MEITIGTLGLQSILATTFKGYTMLELRKKLLLIITIFILSTVSAANEKYLELDIKQIHNAYKQGTLSAEELTKFYLERIEKYDLNGKKLNSFITINPNALKQAKTIDKQRKLHGIQGVLHGIPIVIKDNYDTKDLVTTGGSAALRGHYPKHDAFTVEKLRDAGAIILGKTNMSELALSYGRLGYSSAQGLTLNPYNLKRNASGSSSGSGVAVAANFCVIATGTDTAGSIRGPACVNGTVGVKPTLGLTSRSGVIPASLTLDVTGPIARNVYDAAIALNVMSGVDPKDVRTKESATFVDRDYTKYLDTNSLQNKRLGVITNYSGANKEVDAMFKTALLQLRKQGATTINVTIPTLIENAWSDMMGPVVDTEFKEQIEFYFNTTKAPIQTVAELIQASEASTIKNSPNPVNPGRIDGYKSSLKSMGVVDQNYIAILTHYIPKARAMIEELMKKNNLDALVFPTMLCPASPLYNIKDTTYKCSVSDPYIPSYMGSSTGFPEITVPMGFTKEGLPHGISFFSTAYQEPMLFSLAYAYEQGSKVRKPPND